MSIQLAPDVENAVRHYAEREGVSPEELLRRAFPPVAPIFSVQALLQRWQQEHGLPPRPDGLGHTSARDLFALWAAQDAHLTDAEAAADQKLWEDYQKDHERVSL